MTKFEKNFVGKGKLVDGLSFPVLRMTIKMEQLEKFVREYEGQRMVTIEITELQNPDDFGRTHTAYVSEKVTTPEPVKKTRSKK